MILLKLEAYLLMEIAPGIEAMIINPWELRRGSGFIHFNDWQKW